MEAPMHELPKRVDLSCGRPPESFYVCQIEDRFGLEAWKASPEAKNYTIPRNNWCALVHLSMVLMLEERVPPSLDELFERACAMNVYRPFADGSGWQGAFLDALPGFVASLGLEARLERRHAPESVARGLSELNYVLPRVSPEIRYPTDKEPEKRTGHFVFFYGYELDEEDEPVFRYQNGSGFASLDSQIGVRITTARMRQVFSGDALLIRSRLAV
jgi:hypothetical protein